MVLSALVNCDKPTALQSVDFTFFRFLHLAPFHISALCAMTTLRPRPPYSDDELKQLYPDHLELRLVQVLLRHGERVPVSVRFQNVRVLVPPRYPD